MKRKVAAIVLAAGSSRRMGRAKQLLPIRSSTLARQIVEQALASHVVATVVVLGAEADAIRESLAELPISFVENPRWAEGLGTSISAGLAAVQDCDAAVILACDQPHVSAATINRLIAEHEATGRPIVASAYSDTLGVPALFAREVFDELLELAPEEGAKRLLQEHRDSLAVIEFPEGAVDLDTPADYQRFLTS